MIMKALVLVRVFGKKPEVILEKIRNVKGVSDAFMVFGRFDVCLLLTAPDLPGIKRIVNKLHQKTGIKRTETLIEV